MKILRRHVDKNGLGFVTIVCEEEQDVWNIYNLIRPGDNVRCSTVRKVTTETQTGSKNSQRVHVTLTILVETISYDPTVCILHLKGQNIQENEHVRLGAYHTLDIEINRQFTLTKELWDSVDLERLQQCTDPGHSADVAAVVMHEGLANICLLTSTMTVVKSRIELQIARKRKGFSSQHDKSLARFYSLVVQAFMKHINMENLKCVLIASPGFLKEQFLECLLEEAGKTNNKDIVQNRSKFLLVHSSSGYKHALKEVLADSAVANRMADTKAQAEVKALDTFLDLMNNDPGRAVYGYKHVCLALEQLAIDTLMVSDVLFRSRNIEQRKKYVKLVEKAKDQNVLIHLADNEWRRVRDIEDLEKAIENTNDAREKEKFQDHLNTLYNQPLRMSLFYRLDPHPPEHTITPQEKKPITLQFTNYRKRPAANPPSIITPKKSAKNISAITEAAGIDHSGDERKYHCSVEGCKKSYKNSAGLRSHMRSVHNLSAQQQTRTSVSPAPNYAATNSHINYVPSQNYYPPKEEIKPNDGTTNASGGAPGSIGSLATFNATTSRLHSSDEGFVQPNNLNYRSGSRMTPSEENILNRNLTTMSAAPPRSTTPSSSASQPIRMQDGKYKCDYCSKTYKANANLQKHINDHHARQVNSDTGSNQRPMLSKNVLRTYSIGSNQPQVGGPTLSVQPSQMPTTQQNKSNLLSTKSTAHPSTRSPASPGMVAHSTNLSPAPHVNVQSSGQRQIAPGNQQNLQQRAYVQTRTYAPAQSQNQPIYHVQQTDTPQSLDIQIPQSQSSASPRSYSSSPVTVVLQSQQQASPNVPSQQPIPTEHYQPSPQGPNVRPPAARTYTSQQYYDRYQNSVQQRRPANKNYGAGTYAYQPKQINKQVFRQSAGQEYPRLAAPSGSSMNRVNTVSSTGQPVRITSLNAQPGGSLMNSGHMSGGGQMVSGNGSQMPATYQVRTNFESSRRSPQVSSGGSLSSQLAPLNVNYGNTTTTTTSIEGIQITKVTPSQYGNPRTTIRTGSNAVRGRLPDNVRGGQVYGQGIPRYGAQPQYTQRIMRVVQQSPGNPPILQQETPQQRTVNHPTSSHQSNVADN